MPLPVSWGSPLALLTVLALSSCEGLLTNEIPGSAEPTDRANLAHGADISWLSQLEDRGAAWVDAEGQVTDAIDLLVDLGVDAVRLRIMVNPASTDYLSPDGSSLLGYCDPAGALALARRCRDAGIERFLIDFHFSDTWADGAHQTPPQAWQGLSQADLAQALADHVTEVLTAFVDAGITPEWVQLGNETAGGFLWGTKGTGRIKDNKGWANLATLVNAGYNAVKAVDPSILVALHLDRGGQNALYRWWFDSLRAAGGRWDLIALSFYPHWQPDDTVAMLRANLHDLVDRYGTPVVVAETGGRSSDPAGTRALIAEVKAAVASVPRGQGLGVFYWEPEAAPALVKGYALGAAVAANLPGRPNLYRFTSALDSLGWDQR